MTVFVQECVCQRLIPIRLGSAFEVYFDGSPRESARLDSMSGEGFMSRAHASETTRLAERGNNTPALSIPSGLRGCISGLK